MHKKTAALDFAVKAANLCRFLRSEKDETLISQRLFDASVSLSECAYSLQNPALSKNDLSLLKKEAALSSDKALLCLDMLYMSGCISLAQKDSVLKTLDILKKEINI